MDTLSYQTNVKQFVEMALLCLMRSAMMGTLSTMMDVLQIVRLKLALLATQHRHQRVSANLLVISQFLSYQSQKFPMLPKSVLN
jgi:hypothetical protein